MNITEKVKPVVENVKLHWRTPAKGRFMNYKEIISYAGGGIGAYFIIMLGSTLMVSTTNMIVGGAIGIGAMDMYYLYIIATIAGIPLTAIRANMVDSARNKEGKYRPYLITMGIPTALIAIAYVWFPYDRLPSVFTGSIMGRNTSYIITCVVVLIFNILLQFFFNFFNDAYTNLIHVLSPNTQERTDVLAIKSVVYSLAPSIMNIVLPVIAQLATNNDLYDLKVYRIGYPIFAVIGIALTIVVFANTKEKIIQAKTHTRQLSFIDSFKAVAHNKYFWIIALAGWVGFLEGAYGNILTWSYNYGHTCNGATFAIIQTFTGNASLWGMLLAPLCIRKWGKKKVLIFVNSMNVICIIAMLVNMHSIWWLFLCVYFNWMVGAFEQITTPAIQADIRDYQQYITGERIDGMFATVLTIGNVVTLATSSILPAVQEHYGVSANNGYEKAFDILDVTTGQDGLLYQLMGALIIMAAIGAFLNMVPYFFYDFTEIKQKSVIRVLKVRALFEDYGNKALKDAELVETIDLVEHSKEMALAQPKEISKALYRQAKAEAKAKAKEIKKQEHYKNVLKEIKELKAQLKKAKAVQKAEINAQYTQMKNEFKAQNSKNKPVKNKHYQTEEVKRINEELDALETEKRVKHILVKQVKKQYREDREYNEDIIVSKAVIKELEKFNNPFGIYQHQKCKEIAAGGFDGLRNVSYEQLKEELDKAKGLPKNTEEEKELRNFEIQLVKNRLDSRKYTMKYYLDAPITKPDFTIFTDCIEKYEDVETAIADAYKQKSDAKHSDNKERVEQLDNFIKQSKATLKELDVKIKAYEKEELKFNRAARAYYSANKILTQYENYQHFNDIAEMYEESKVRAEQAAAEKEAEAARLKAESDAEKERLKAERAAKKADKKTTKDSKKDK